jgi:hypothetical protein
MRAAGHFLSGRYLRGLFPYNEETACSDAYLFGIGGEFRVTAQAAIA